MEKLDNRSYIDGISKKYNDLEQENSSDFQINNHHEIEFVDNDLDEEESLDEENEEEKNINFLNVTTRRIKNHDLQNKINFDFEKRILKPKIQKKLCDYTGVQKIKPSIIYKEPNENLKIDIKDEIKKIEEHFINSNREEKPILYDEDLNQKIQLEISKKVENENNINLDANKILNFNSDKLKNDNFMKDGEKCINELKDPEFPDEFIDFKNKLNENNDVYKFEDYKEKHETNFTNLNNIVNSNKEIAENYQQENFGNTYDVMVISYIEDKMQSEHKGVFYGMNKIFLFINKRSGSQEGKMILEVAEKNQKNFILKESDNDLFNELYKNIKVVKISSTLKDKNIPEDVYVHVIDLMEKDKKLNGIEKLKHDSVYDENIIVLIAGGDGTVLQIVEELHKNEININRCVFGHIPLGTGNDLSNSMGFNSSIDIPDDFVKFQALLLKYFHAEFTTIDIWQARLSLEDLKGDIIKADNFARKSSLRNLDEEFKKKNIFKKTFINYLSLGYDARVGYGFDKNRSSSRCWNKCIYFWEGLKKNCCTKTARINNIIEKFEEIAEDRYFFENLNTFGNKKEGLNDDHILNNNDINLDIKDPNKQDSNKDSFMTMNEDKQPRNVIFFGKNEATTKEQIIKNKQFLKGNPVNLICQNINFYMGGAKDIWKNSNNNIGLDINDKEFIQKVKNWKQSFNDKKLEFFSYSSGFELGLEKINSGHANKVYQGKGPFIIKFKNFNDIDQKDKVNRIFLNIDGEYFRLLKPIELRIRLNKKINNGEIRFLLNSKQK